MGLRLDPVQDAERADKDTQPPTGPGDRAANTLGREPEAQRALRRGVSVARGPEATPGALAAASADARGVLRVAGRELRSRRSPWGGVRMSATAGRPETPPGARPALEHQGPQATTRRQPCWALLGCRVAGTQERNAAGPSGAHILEGETDDLSRH